MEYNWQQADWPEFCFDSGQIEEDLLVFADKAGQVGGLLRALPEGTRDEAVVDILITEAMKTSEIEGEYLSRPDVASSVRKQLGLNVVADPVRDIRSVGAAELAVQVRETWDLPLSDALLFAWHKTLFQGVRGQAVGCWRRHETPMRVISPRIDKPVVHFEAPPSAQVPAEMQRFIAWFDASRREIKQAPVRSALAHLYFESIHPFEDGNGRIGRAIAEKALSEGLGRPVLLSLSRAIEANRAGYYDALKQAQRSNEVTEWVQYFVRTIVEAQEQAESLVVFVLKKAQFFDRFRGKFNERQVKVIQRMLQAGPTGFEGGINARKYKNLTEVSKATATRDLQELVAMGALLPVGAGRSARYELAL
ncbi:MAG: Fic family protein [Puniceicoccaceae bacterium]|nr:MAG: Fic family protein [Puniceicoccaceae bacterium]